MQTPLGLCNFQYQRLLFIGPSSPIQGDKEGKCIHDMVYHVRNIKHVRSFGLLLNIESGKLDIFERDPVNIISNIVREWFKTPMSIAERWAKLHEILQQQELQERTLAKNIPAALVRQASSVDSAISELSGTPRSSITSSLEALPQYQMSSIGK